MENQFVTVGDILVVKLHGELSGTNATDVENKILDALDKGSRAMLLDLTHLAYTSSAGLRVFLIANKRLTSQSGKMVMCGVCPEIQEVLEMSGFTSLLDITDSPEAAMERLAA